MFGTIPPYFWGIVPIEKGQAILPVLWVQHLIKRCKYEFLPHAMPTLRSSCLTRQPFHAVLTEFEICFLCLLHLILCAVNELTSKRFYAILKAEKSILCSHLRASRYDGNQSCFVADHTFDHLRLRTTRITCREEHTKAVNPDAKAPKSP